MLKQRVLTALLLAPPAIAVVLLLPSAWVAIILMSLFLLGGREWARLVMGDDKPWAHWTAPIALGVAAIVLYRWGATAVNSAETTGVVIAGVLWWFVALLWLKEHRRSDVQNKRMQLIKFAAGTMVILPGWCALIWLHRTSPSWLLYLLLLIWAADVGAYFAGRRWGKNKLAPSISPGKTIEGLYGALATGAVVGAAAAWVQGLGPGYGALMVLLSLTVVLFSIAGDLFESVIKRQAGRKDSGTLLPGHGGVLDRCDSLFAAAPVFAYGLMLIQPVGSASWLLPG